MNTKNTNKKIVIGFIALILAGAAFGFFFSGRNSKNVPDPRIVDSTQFNSKETTPAMGAKPEADPKDGSVAVIVDFVKANAKNPATFEFYEWSEISSEGGYWKVRCKYKGVASFGKEVTTNAWFYIRDNKVVHTRVISKI